MASTIDSIRTVLLSKSSVIKVSVISLIISYPLFQVYTHFEGWYSLWSIVSYCAIVFYAGYLFLTSHNLVNENDNLLPAFFNPFKIFFVGLGGLLSLIPISALMGYSGYCLYQIFTQAGFSQPVVIALVSLIELILFGVFAVQLTLFAFKFNPFTSFNIVKVLKTFSEFTLRTIGLIITLTFFGGFVLYPIGYVVFLMFGPQSYLLFFYYFFALSFILLSAVVFYSQIAMEDMVLFVKVAKNEETAADILDKSLLIDNDK